MPDSKFDLGDYVQVKDRIAIFYELYGSGRLVTDEVTILTDPANKQRVMVKALAYRTPDDTHPAVGYSWMELPGTTPYTKGSELENTETSAWGRAIAALGILIDKSIATGEEIQNKSTGDESEDEEESTTTHDGGLIGVARVGKADADFELRQSPMGTRLVFRLVQGRKGIKVIALDALAEAIALVRSEIEGQRVTVWGTLHDETFRPKGAQRDVTYQVVHAERIATPDYILPGPSEPVEAESIPLPLNEQPLTEDERQLIAGGLK